MNSDCQINSTKAKYAKGKMAVRVQSIDGFKSRAHRLLEYVGAKWTNRERAYIATPSQLEKAQTLLSCGYDASPILGEIIRPAGEVAEPYNKLLAASAAGVPVAPLTIARAKAREVADAIERRRRAKKVKQDPAQRGK